MIFETTPVNIDVVVVSQLYPSLLTLIEPILPISYPPAIQLNTRGSENIIVFTVNVLVIN